MRLIIYLILATMITPAALRAQKIDALRDSAEVLAFVGMLKHDWYRITYQKPERYFIKKYVAQRQRGLGIRPYEKADIDGNGLTDLLFNGFDTSGRQLAFVVLDRGNNDFLLKDLTNYSNSSFIAARLIALEHTTYILTNIIDYHSKRYSKKTERTERTDTIRFAMDAFIEKGAPGQFTMQEFRYAMCGAMGIEPFALIFKNDSVTYLKSTSPWRTENELPGGTYRGWLPPEIKKELTQWLQLVNFPALSDSYPEHGSDTSPQITVLIDDQGKRKRIIDFGEASYSLHALEHYLYHLKDKLQWTWIGEEQYFYTFGPEWDE
ncbi:hypothetical protein [Paraflavitalea pollutisoli]|uniref:hypothetical protein n=1 Tax=Paraflavitalea pollutisoli TaxID=3034143 RepID=UPI0023EDEC67|nr:hypothetical protein [Paraflavitalea sp. H1-2-19X]